jgi:putative flippase GtrA
MDSAYSTPLPVPAEAGVVLRMGKGLAQFIRYFWVSAAALAFDLGLLTFLVQWGGWAYLPAAALSFSCGTVVAFVLSSSWAFEVRSFSSSGQGLLIFAVIGMGGLLINLAGLWVGSEIFGVVYWLSKLGAAVASFLFNFAVRRAVLFSEKRRY